MITWHVHIEGQVQGVGFRATTLSLARGLDVHGFVRNEHDGSVTLDVDGAEATLNGLLSQVESVMRGRIDVVDVEKRPSLNRTDGLHIKG